MRKNKLGLTTQVIIIFAIFLLAVNVVLGGVLIDQSKTAIKTLIQNRMLDISNTAAAMLDGDDMEQLTPEDPESPVYREVVRTLSIFQNNIDLAYIYALKQTGEKEYVFTVDPDPVNPGAFGEKVVYTEALEKAGHGIASVDEEPFEDRWGRFYSAYSPVFDSTGEVAGIVCVDFDATWYDAQIAKNTASIVVISVLSLSVGGLIVLLFTMQIRKRFRALYNEFSSLAFDIEDLTEKLTPNQGYEDDAEIKRFEKKLLNVPQKPLQEAEGEKRQDAISELGDKIRLMQKKLRAYIAYVHDQAYTDSMTGVKNKTAYLDVVRHLDKKIQEGTANFSIAVFDVNGLKEINDRYGHVHGDRIITDAALLMRRVFAAAHLYRIGGDEFIAVLENTTPERVEAMFSKLERELKSFNVRERKYETPLTFSKGAATFMPEKDKEFREVFRRADECMYRDKGAYYMQFGDRRKPKESTV